MLHFLRQAAPSLEKQVGPRHPGRSISFRHVATFFFLYELQSTNSNDRLVLVMVRNLLPGFRLSVGRIQDVMLTECKNGSSVVFDFYIVR